MRNLIRRILKEEQEWFDDIKPLDVYLPWVDSAIRGFEEWEGDAYQTDDEIGNAIRDLKNVPSKKNVEYTIETIERWKGHAYVEGDDFDWALDYLKMSIDPREWERFNVFSPDNKTIRGYPYSAYQINEALRDTYMTDESYSCLVTEDEEWILLRNNNMGSKPIPTLLKTDNLDVNSLSSCYLINDRMLELNWRHFRRASKVFLKDNLTHFGTQPVDNNFQLKVVKFKDGIVLDRPYDTDNFFQ